MDHLIFCDDPEDCVTYNDGLVALKTMFVPVVDCQTIVAAPL